MKTFKINNNLEVVAESQKTRYGFRHIATLLKNGNEIDREKCCYYNRTWESYEFESVLEKLLENTKKLTGQERVEFKDMIVSPNRTEDELKPFKTLGKVLKLGSLFNESKEDQNKFKKQCVQAMGVDFPEDWDNLSEEEKEKRFNNLEKETTKE
jgi:hypothetical protein